MADNRISGTRRGKSLARYTFVKGKIAEREVADFMRLDVLVLRRLAALLTAMAAASSAVGESKSVQVPAGTPFVVKLTHHVPMKIGQPLECKLVYPVYAENELVIPAGSVVRGSVIALNSDRSRRIHALLRGDFTPFHIPVVRFGQLVLPDGTTEQIAGSDATNGAPVLQLSPPASGKRKSFLAQQIGQIKESGKAMAAEVTAPGRTDRLVQFIYGQLPYHPERVEAATTWTIALAQPLAVMKDDKVNPALQAQAGGAHSGSAPVQTASGEQAAWHIRAYLQQTISSATEKPGNTFEAVIAEPIFNPDHTVAVPEGSVLVGTVTRAKAARSFGRAGTLRFDFRMLRLPGAVQERVAGTLTGADADKSQKLEMDQEGGVAPKPQNRVIVPLVLSLLASRALDEDSSQAGSAAIGSNGFGLVGRVIGIAGGSRGLAAGIGFYGAGVAFSERWLVRGQNVAFVKNTRIEVTTVPSRESLSPAGAEAGHPGTQ
jgi:hypothetical protein